MRYGYDANGNRKWAYDKATAVNTSSRYDASGNGIGPTDANGASTTYVYDKSNRLTTTKYPGGSTVTIG